MLATDETVSLAEWMTPVLVPLIRAMCLILCYVYAMQVF